MSTKAAPAPPAKKAETSPSAPGAARAQPARVHVPPHPAPHSVVGRLQGGSPLPRTLRERMESSFGRSFESVRVHTGGAAEELTREHHAEALTVGSQIAFKPDRFRPETPSGQHLVAHELAHVAQQGITGMSLPQAQSLDTVPGEPSEVAADTAAALAVRGERVASLGTDYSLRGRVMRRALPGLRPPPNPAPLRSRIAPPAARPALPVRSPEAMAEAAPARADRTAALEAALTPAPEPQPATGQGVMLAQEQTEQAREASREAAQEVAEEQAPAEPGGEVPQLAGAGAAAAPAPEAVQEPPSVAEADRKEEAQAEAEAAQAGEAAKEEEGAAAESAGPNGKAPSSPDEDPAFQRVVSRARKVARRQAHNNTAKRKAAEAQAAALGPPNEVEAMAGGNQVGKMAEQEPAAFDKESFKAALLERINAIAPGTLDEADNFKDRGAAGELKAAVVGQVEAGKEGAQGPVKQTAEEPPDTSAVEPKPVVPQPPTEAGPPPPDIGAAAAAPKPRSEAEVSLEAGPRSLEDKMAEARVNDDTLVNSNEPDFVAAVDAKNEAKQHAETAPEAYRQDEAAIVQQAESEAAGTAQGQTQAMHETRAQQFSQVQGEQDSTRSADEAKRAEITSNIQSIFEETRTKVQERLSALDGEVNTEFDAGAEAARQGFEAEVEREKEAWKDRRYSGLRGKARWIRDVFLPLPDEVNQIYQAARQHYIDAMSGVIDRVAGLVETGLNEAMGLIAAGRDAVLTYVGTLDEDLRQIGEEAAAGIQEQFDSLAQEVNSHEEALVDTLAQKYVDNLNAIDARIEAMKQDDRGLVGRAMDAIQGVINTILELKDMLLGILARAAGVIEAIISDPIGFLGNLVTGIKMGLSAFLGNIVEHLKNGLMGWLFGAAAAAGIQIPESFDLKGLLGLGAQILGLTYQNIRARAVKIVGEPMVSAMETAVEIFRILMTEGLGGVWTYIKDMLANLVETVLGGIRDWVIQRVVMAGITWLLSMLNPASAFVRACKMIIDVVMFFIERGSQIMALVNGILDSIAAIASGSLGAMAAAVEGALARAIPVAISFLASLLGLGGVSSVIRSNIEKIQAPVNRAIDWLIGKAVSLARGVAGLFGGRKKETREAEEPPARPEGELTDAQAAAEAALAQRLGPDTSEAEANTVLPQVRGELAPLGLKNLLLLPGEADGEYEVYAESSPRKRVARLIRKRVTVAISATITMKEGEEPVEGLARPRGPGRYDFGESITFRPMDNAEALGGTGRASPLTPVLQPPGTPARRGSQRSGGVVIEPEPGSSTLEVLAWNTSQPERGHNVSHAERQFVNWFEDRPYAWRQRVKSVHIVVEGRPVCGNCEADLQSLRRRFPYITFTWSGPPASNAEPLETKSG